MVHDRNGRKLHKTVEDGKAFGTGAARQWSKRCFLNNCHAREVFAVGVSCGHLLLPRPSPVRSKEGVCLANCFLLPLHVAIRHQRNRAMHNGSYSADRLRCNPECIRRGVVVSCRAIGHASDGSLKTLAHLPCKSLPASEVIRSKSGQFEGIKHPPSNLFPFIHTLHHSFLWHSK